MTSNRGSLKGGFALPAVLAVTGVVTLIFLVAITALASLNAEARSARDRLRFTQSALSMEAQIAYLAATNPLDSQGLVLGGARNRDEFDTTVTIEPTTGQEPVATGVIRLDARPYRIDQPYPLSVSIQDQGGLINLATLDEPAQRRLLRAMGVDENSISGLIAGFRDYVDTDSLRRIDGAEAPQYQDTGPANRPLRRPEEWLSVLNARTAVAPASWRRVRSDIAYDATFATLNVNTMTSNAMQVLFDLSPRQAEAAIQARERSAFLTITDLETVTGRSGLGDSETLYTFPSGRLIYTIRDGRSPWTYRGRITLTPTGLEQPIWIDQTEQTEAPRRAVAPITDAVSFPYTPR